MYVESREWRLDETLLSNILKQLVVIENAEDILVTIIQKDSVAFICPGVRFEGLLYLLLGLKVGIEVMLFTTLLTA